MAVSVSQDPVPRLPHEQDESADSQSGEPQKVIKNAAADLKRGLKNTDGSAEMDQAYRKLKSNP